MNLIFLIISILLPICDSILPYYRTHSNFGQSQRKVRQVQRDLSYRWPNNIVPYFVGNVTSDVRKSVRLAMEELHAWTCVRFQQVDSKYNGDALRIVDLGSCSSPIGRLEIGIQDVSLTKNCWGMGTAIHELMHAIGIEHTQSRSDRNTYLDILAQNIDQRDLPNFELLSPRLWANLVPYDYGSVMHYGADSFSNKDNQMTMLSKDRSFIETMGSLIPNFYDFDQINQYYECYDKCRLNSRTANCANGGIPNPSNCQVCNCPLGYGGDLCDQRPSGCGSTLVASSTMQTQRFSVKFDKKDDQYFTFCNYWIVAPPSSTIQIFYKITSEAVRKAICTFGCYEGGVEVKHLQDPRITNDRDCCLDTTLNVTTTVNPLPIILYTSKQTVTYEFSFRYL